MRALIATLAGLVMLAPAAAGAASCQAQIPAAERFIAQLRPGPNTSAAQRHLEAARRASTESQCAAELRQVDTYARRSAALDERTAPRTRGYGSSVAPVPCADFLHQDRPGGSDYHGPPVPGCPAR
ncbi:MAG TPA: hypothetical protein VFA50_13880 [Stellaceae bacterium]|nr:hypothetical protein [Stellaceae bacterium]